MSAISVPARGAGRSKEVPAAGLASAGTGVGTVKQGLRGRVPAGLSNGDPEYVMLWGTDNADPRSRSDSRR